MIATRDPAATLTALNALLVAVARHNPFYRPRLEQAGFAQGAPSLEEFSARMPFTTKQELVDDQQRHPPYGSNLTWPLERYVRYNQTSATTGAPLRVLDTREDWQWMLDNWKRVYAAAGIAAGRRVFFAFSFGPFLGFWTAFDAATQLDCLCIPGGGMSSTARLRAIVDNRIDAVCCTPTYAVRLGEVARDEGLFAGGQPVRVLIVAGEPGGSIPAVRARIAALWPGARVVDHHGMTEVGPVSVERAGCPGSLEVFVSAYLVEMIDPATGVPVADGEIGELVLTPLGRVGWPLLRYRTGDLARCRRDGDTVLLEGGILGRADDMVLVRGVNVYPSAVEEIVRRFDDIEEYRVELREVETMTELRIEIEARGGESTARRLTTALRNVLHLRVPVAVVPPHTLPRFEMKARRWVRRAEPPA